MKSTFKIITALALLLVAASGVVSVCAVPEIEAPSTVQINTGVGANEAADTILPAQERERVGRLGGELPQIQVILAVGPSSSSPSYEPWLEKWVNYLETGFAPAGNRATDPTALYIPSQLETWDIVETTLDDPLWMGVFNPTLPALSGEKGNAAYIGVRVKWSKGFRMADLIVGIASSDATPKLPWGSLAITERLENINYSKVAVGIVWKDGIEGRAGAVRVTSGPSTRLVNELYFTGISSGYRVNTLAGMDNARAYILQQLVQFVITGRYAILSSDGVNAIAEATEKWPVVAKVEPPTKPPQKSLSLALIATGSPGEVRVIQWAPTASGPWNYFVTVTNPPQGGGNSIGFTPAVGETARFYRVAP